MRARERTDTAQKLDQALAAWEKSADMPALAGEIEPWAAEVLKGLGEVEAAFKQNLESNESEYRQILKTDITLTPRVDELRVQDTALALQLSQARDRLERSARRTSRPAETSEEPVAEAAALRQAILDFIVRCRAHEAELRAWLVESLYRDDGDGD